MHFEVHITVADSQSEKFRAYCKEQGWKSLKIWLLSKHPISNRLKHPVHTMCATRLNGDMNHGITEALKMVEKVSSEFQVQRMKLEIPYDEAISGFVYHETHVKANRFDSTFKYANSLNEWGDRKPLLTYRSRSKLPLESDFRDYEVLDYEAETVLIDTNPEMDAGWCDI